MLKRVAVTIFSMGAIVLGAGEVYGQAFPNKAIRVINAGAQGGSDFVARLVAQGLTGPLSQPVIVENRGDFSAIETVLNAPPDGYTLLFIGANVYIKPLLQYVSYDPIKDFAPITQINTSSSILVVHPSLPVKSVKELIALAKARPGELNYSSSGLGSESHLAAELFKAMAGVNIARIVYKSGSEYVNALIAGEVQLSLPNASTAAPHVKSGKLRALAVTSPEPSALYPGLPTIAASGLPGYESQNKQGVYAPAKTPAQVINRLNQEIVRFLKTAEVKERFLSVGSEIVGNSPEMMSAYIKAEMARLGKVIKNAGIKAD